MNKTKFRSLGVAFLISAILLALVTVAWPFVPDSLKSQLDSVHLPIVNETTTTQEESTTTTTAATTTATTSSTVASRPVTIRIVPGEVSTDVARKLEEAGAISDARAFVDYLLENDIAENILAGEFEIQPNSTFEQIARTIGALR